MRALDAITDKFLNGLSGRCSDLREERGMTLQEVADRIGTTKSHVWEFERGRVANPTIGMLLGMARCFGVSISHLLGEDAKAPRLHPEAMKIAAQVDALIRKPMKR